MWQEFWIPIRIPKFWKHFFKGTVWAPCDTSSINCIELKVVHVWAVAVVKAFKMVTRLECSDRTDLVFFCYCTHGTVPGKFACSRTYYSKGCYNLHWSHINLTSSKVGKKNFNSCLCIPVCYPTRAGRREGWFTSALQNFNLSYRASLFLKLNLS